MSQYFNDKPYSLFKDAKKSKLTRPFTSTSTRKGRSKRRPRPININIIVKCPCQDFHNRNARRLELREVVDMSDIVATVGDSPITLRQFPLKNAVGDPDDIDTTVENPRFGYRTEDSGLTTAPDGSSSIVQSAGDVTISFLVPSEKDPDGNPVPSVLASDVDPKQDGVSGPTIRTTVNITVLSPAETDAVRLELRQV